MARFSVIGLGTFGSEVARALYERGHEVLGIDRDRARVQDLRDHCSQAVVADGTDQQALEAVGVRGSDAVVVSLGERMDASILATLYLREMGLKRIVAKAVSSDHEKVLRMIGAHEVVHPERDTAHRLATALGARSILEILPLGVGFSLMEVAAIKAFVGRTLGDLEIRKRFQVLVVAVKNGERLDLVPGASYTVDPGDILVLIGRNSDLEEFARKAD